MKTIIAISSIAFLTACGTPLDLVQTATMMDKGTSEMCKDKLRIEKPKPSSVSEEKYEEYLHDQCRGAFDFSLYPKK